MSDAKPLALTRLPGESPCAFALGLDGWATCLVHGWSGGREQRRRVLICPDAASPAEALNATVGDQWDQEPFTEAELHTLADADESDDPLTVTIRRVLIRAHLSGIVFGGRTDIIDPSGWTKGTLPAVAALIAGALSTAAQTAETGPASNE